MSLDDLAARPKVNQANPPCAVCGEPAKARVEVVVSRIPVPAGRRRGVVVRTVQRSMCELHAFQYFRLVESPRRQPPGQRP